MIGRVRAEEPYSPQNGVPPPLVSSQDHPATGHTPDHSGQKIFVPTAWWWDRPHHHTFGCAPLQTLSTNSAEIRKIMISNTQSDWLNSADSNALASLKMVDFRDSSSDETFTVWPASLFEMILSAMLLRLPSRR